MIKLNPIKALRSLLIFGVLFAIFTAGCDSLPIGPEPTPTPAPQREEGIVPVVSATGVIVPTQYNTLGMSTAGLVIEVLVNEGQAVEDIGKIIP